MSKQLGCPYIRREGHSIRDLYESWQMKQAIIVAKNGWRYEDQKGNRFSFHPNMAALRMKQLQMGQKDSMVECSGMKAGDAVLDCTLGMGADSIVASYIVGEQGKVVALESQPIIANIVKHGLATYETDRKTLQQAMRNITVLEEDYRSFLPSLDDSSFDIILFDPMFRETVKTSTAMQKLKPLANPEPLDLISVHEAIRVSRKAVLLKERRGSPEFDRLGFSIIREASTYAWGIIRKKEGD